MASTAAPLLYLFFCVPLWLARSGGRLVDYQGDRSARHLKDWALGLLPKHIKSVNKEAQLVGRCFFFPVGKPLGRGAGTQRAGLVGGALGSSICVFGIHRDLINITRPNPVALPATPAPPPGRLPAAVPGGQQGRRQVGRVRAAAQVRP